MKGPLVGRGKKLRYFSRKRAMEVLKNTSM
jgi:hypothetical protein